MVPSDNSDMTQLKHIVCQCCGATHDASGQPLSAAVESIPAATSNPKVYAGGSSPTVSGRTENMSTGTATTVGCELLGVNGKLTTEANAAVWVLKEAHDADERMQVEYSAMIAMPSWSLSQVCRISDSRSSHPLFRSGKMHHADPEVIVDSRTHAVRIHFKFVTVVANEICCVSVPFS